MRLRMSVVVAVVCLLVPVFSAQADRGRITGVITDTGGAVLPGVTVTLAGPEQRSVVTNDRGEFTFDNLAPGRYTLRATLPGFVDLMRDVSVAGAGRGAPHAADGCRRTLRNCRGVGRIACVSRDVPHRLRPAFRAAFPAASSAVLSAVVAATRRATVLEATSTPRPTTTSTRAACAVSRTIRCRRSRSTSIPRPTRTSAGS